jgi:hypothetical protein
MKLADLRRLAVKKNLSIHFRLRNGMECIVNREGLAGVPALKAIPDFNLEDELAAAVDFLLDPLPPSQPRTIRREEMISMSADAPVAAVTHDHDDE